MVGPINRRVAGTPTDSNPAAISNFRSSPSNRYGRSLLACLRLPAAIDEASYFLRPGDVLVLSTRGLPADVTLPFVVRSSSGAGDDLRARARRSSLRSRAVSRDTAANRRLTLLSASSKTSALPAFREFAALPAPRAPLASTLAAPARRYSLTYLFRPRRIRVCRSIKSSSDRSAISDLVVSRIKTYSSSDKEFNSFFMPNPILRRPSSVTRMGSIGTGFGAAELVGPTRLHNSRASLFFVRLRAAILRTIGDGAASSASNIGNPRAGSAATATLHA